MTQGGTEASDNTSLFQVFNPCYKLGFSEPNLVGQHCKWPRIDRQVPLDETNDLFVKFIYHKDALTCFPNFNVEYRIAPLLSSEIFIAMTGLMVYLETQVNLEVPSMYAFQKIVEKRIKDAEKRGEFDDLPGSGEPLTLEDDSQIPEDLRLAYKILKNADCLPPELELKKEIRKMEDMLEDIPDEKEKYRHIKRINYKIMQLNMMGKKSPLMEETEIYYSKLVRKLAQK